MAYIQADVDIMNQALRRVGAEDIVLSDANSPSTKNARVVTSYYDGTVKEVLRIIPWNSAIGRQVLTPVSDTTTKFTKKCDLSTVTDLVRTLELNGDPSIPYRVEGNSLYCNETTVSLRYIKKLVPPFSDSVLNEAIIARLASKICVAMAANAELAQVLYQEFTLDMGIAKQICVSEDRIDVIDLLGLYAQSAEIAMRMNKTEG
jgi:hypothetical protein